MRRIKKIAGVLIHKARLNIRRFLRGRVFCMQELPAVEQSLDEKCFIMSFADNASPTVDDYIKMYNLGKNPEYQQIAVRVLLAKLNSFYQFRDEEVIFLDYTLSDGYEDLLKIFGNKIPIVYYSIHMQMKNFDTGMRHRIRMKRFDVGDDVWNLGDQPCAYDAYINGDRRIESLARALHE